MAHALCSLAQGRVVAYALVLAAMAAFGIATREYELLGMDTYPVIASGMLRSPADVWTIFTSEAVPGRVPYPFYGFYRPLVTISLGIDHALYGVAPRGYFVTQALLLGASAVALYELARRMFGARAAVGPLATLITFLLAPSLVETLAVVARRSEPICGIFAAMALATQISRTDRGKRMTVLPALFTLVAVVAKTTALALLPALFALVATRSREAGLAGRVREACTALVPHVLAVGLVFAVQISILGQIGGHLTSRVGGGVDRLPWALGALATWLFVPQPALRASIATWVLLGALTAALVTTLALLGRREAHDARTVVMPLHGPLLVAAVWLLGTASLYGAVGLVQGWYVYVPTMAYALLCGTVAEGLARMLRHGAGTLRLAALASVVVGALWTAWLSRYSLLLGPYEPLDRASAVTRAYLDTLEARIAGAADGSMVVVPAPPRRLPPQPGERTLDGPLLLPEYAFQSWADVAFPERRIEVHDGAREPVPPPRDGSLIVVFER